MSEAVSILETREADRRLLMKLQHRLLGTPPETQVQQPEDRTFALVMALAPMAFAFFYLMVLNFILFR